MKNHPKTKASPLKTTLITALGTILLTFNAAAAGTPHSIGKWDQETLELFAAIPVQDGGRVKPLSTFASFRLLQVNGKRSLKTEDGARLTPLEWLLDCLFYPEQAKDYRNFRIADPAAVTAIGGTPRSERMDYYSYNELLTHRPKLFELAGNYSAIKDADRNSLQRVILGLAYAMSDYDSLLNYFNFARQHYHAEGGELAKLFPNSVASAPSGSDVELALSGIVAQGRGLREAYTKLRAQGENADPAETRAFSDLFRSLDHVSSSGNTIALFPPGDLTEKEWRTPADLVSAVFGDLEAGTLQNDLTALAALEHLIHQRDNPLAFRQKLTEFQSIVVNQASERGEYAKVTMEISYYKGKYLFYAQWLFVLSFLIIALTWILPDKPILNKAAAAAVIVPLVFLVIAITLRCFIRGRPPVTTLYETILFVTATAVLCALAMEFMNRQRIAIFLASLFGILGVFIANKYELSEKQDTMPSMVAVLDTNFWLSTHVTTIVMGYAAGLLAAGIAHVYILGKLVNFKKNDPQFYAAITRMVYGIVAFGLLFSFVGTVLGGIWANYSWGRFWGWDPKENGALLIVLCNLAILHGRLGGYLQDLGLHVASIFAGCVVAFSWWGVNLLGVGLHSYGFTSGILRTLVIFWGFEAFIMSLGLVIALVIALRRRSAEAIPPPAKEADAPAK